MPTYVYRREDGTKFEIKQSIKDDPLDTCPETGQPVERIISGSAGLIFKGSGFYETDYKRANGTSSASSPSNGSANGSSNGSAESSSSSGSAASDGSGSSESSSTSTAAAGASSGTDD